MEKSADRDDEARTIGEGQNDRGRPERQGEGRILHEPRSATVVLALVDADDAEILFLGARPSYGN